VKLGREFLYTLRYVLGAALALARHHANFGS